MLYEVITPGDPLEFSGDQLLHEPPHISFSGQPEPPAARCNRGHSHKQHAPLVDPFIGQLSSWRHPAYSIQYDGIPPDLRAHRRITSYNVCYTKLLRMSRTVLKTILCPTCHKLISADEDHCPYCGASKPGSWLHNNFTARLFNDPARFIKGIIYVITSYSIHYTKLYEMVI